MSLCDDAAIFMGNEYRPEKEITQLHFRPGKHFFHLKGTERK
jgi:hypothetical protein